MSWFGRGEPGHLRTGKWGEKLAARFLKKDGYKIIGKRVRIGPKDELDLVARKGDGLVFVEVKTRADESRGRPMDAITRDKRKSLSRGAVTYLQKLSTRPVFVRFDVVEVVGSPGDKAPVIRHIKDAVAIDDRYRLRW